MKAFAWTNRGTRFHGGLASGVSLAFSEGP